jgi:hypothetical protein
MTSSLITKWIWATISKETAENLARDHGRDYQFLEEVEDIELSDHIILTIHADVPMLVLLSQYKDELKGFEIIKIKRTRLMLGPKDWREKKREKAEREERKRIEAPARLERQKKRDARELSWLEEKRDLLITRAERRLERAETHSRRHRCMACNKTFNVSYRERSTCKFCGSLDLRMMSREARWEITDAISEFSYYLLRLNEMRPTLSEIKRQKNREAMRAAEAKRAGDRAEAELLKAMFNVTETR